MTDLLNSRLTSPWCWKLGLSPREYLLVYFTARKQVVEPALLSAANLRQPVDEHPVPPQNPSVRLLAIGCCQSTTPVHTHSQLLQMPEDACCIGDSVNSVVPGLANQAQCEFVRRQRNLVNVLRSARSW
jgi:hypothetical protein